MKALSTNSNKATIPFVAGALFVILQQANVVSEWVAMVFTNPNLVWDSVLVLVMTGAAWLAPRNKTN